MWDNPYSLHLPQDLEWQVVGILGRHLWSHWLWLWLLILRLLILRLQWLLILRLLWLVGTLWSTNSLIT